MWLTTQKSFCQTLKKRHYIGSYLKKQRIFDMNTSNESLWPSESVVSYIFALLPLPIHLHRTNLILQKFIISISQFKLVLVPQNRIDPEKTENF